MVGITDQRGPETRLADAMLVPKLQRDGVKPLHQIGQAPGLAVIDTKFIEHRFSPVLKVNLVWRQIFPPSRAKRDPGCARNR